MRQKQRIVAWSVPALIAMQLGAAGCGDDSAPSGGTIQHWDGVTWSLSAHTGGPNSRYLREVWGSARNDVWAVGLGRIMHWDGARWTESIRRPDEAAFSSIWGSGANDVWAGGNELLHWDGATWSPVAFPPGMSAIHRGFSPRPGSAWMTASLPGTNASIWGMVMEWDGVNWRIVWRGDSQEAGWSHAYGIWGSGPDDVWAVGNDSDEESSLVLRWNGTVWSSSRHGGDDFHEVFGTGANDVWALGDSGRLLRWNGAGWSPQTGLANDPISIWGSGPDDVWIVGDFGGGYHWDGNAFSHRPATGDHGIGCAVWGSGPNDVWVVGGIES